jgi:hypothetical protein
MGRPEPGLQIAPMEGLHALDLTPERCAQRLRKQDDPVPRARCRRGRSALPEIQVADAGQSTPTGATRCRTGARPSSRSAVELRDTARASSQVNTVGRAVGTLDDCTLSSHGNSAPACLYRNSRALRAWF